MNSNEKDPFLMLFLFQEWLHCIKKVNIDNGLLFRIFIPFKYIVLTSEFSISKALLIQVKAFE